MRIQLLPSSIDDSGQATPDQRLTCYLIDERVTIDAGSIAISLTDKQRDSVRDVIITHPHMDHIASLPIFIDDLFAELREPIRIHATDAVIELLERDVFNWTVYPRFSELTNEHGPVMRYVPFAPGKEFQVAHLKITAVEVNHIVPTVGMVLSDGNATVAFSSDTAETDEFWKLVNSSTRIDALLIEASFPNSMKQLAEVSKHLTPASLQKELQKLNHHGIDILVVHLKPTYRQTLIEELNELGIAKLKIMQPSHVYEW